MVDVMGNYLVSVISTGLRLAQKRWVVQAKSRNLGQVAGNQRLGCLQPMVDDLGSLMK